MVDHIQLPTPEMMVDHLDGQIHTLLQENEKLRSALRRLVDNVLDYEKVNNLSPNPGRKYCWDTVEQAISVLENTD